MPELPKSWGLKTKKNARGKCEVWGKDDSGNDYKVRECDTASVTEKDVTELKAADRESYSNRESGAREFVKNLVGPQPDKNPEAQLTAQLEFDESDWIEAALPVVHAGFGRKGCAIGFSHIPQEKWDALWRN